eukprot:s19_g11.t1
MAMLVPSFDPAKDDLEQYTQKVELLSEIWPQSKMNELIARLILNTSGSAFQKLQLNKAKLMTGDKSGTQLLVTTLGGQWGKVNLEKTYEIVEKALFKCVQRQDESNDSFLARCDVVWSELKSKKIDLDQVHAYIVLRGSLLNSEDKKRVILESESASTGVLTIEKVSQSVRMLGTSFFNDMIGVKKSKGKIYDQQILMTEDTSEDVSEGSAFVADETGEDDFFEQLLHEEDEDALLIADYESAAADALQSDEDLASAFTSYSEARKRLSDRFKNRGFWPISGGKGKTKSFGKGKGRSFGRGPRKSLQQRIMESTCRNCGRRGHWKAECPDKQRSSNSSSSQNASATMTAEAVSLEGEPDAMPMELFDPPRHPKMSLASRLDRVMAQGSSESLEAFKKLSIAEMGEHKVTFGKTHCGKTYSHMWQAEKGWVRWFSKTYGTSDKEEHRKMLVFIEAMIAQHEEFYEMEPIPEAEKQQVVAPKAKMMPKSKAAPMPAMSVATDVSEEVEPWDPWDVMGPPDQSMPMTYTPQQEIIDALQCRVLTVENALNEILSSPWSPLDHILNAGDWEYDFDHEANFTHSINHCQQKFNQLVSQFTKEFEEVSQNRNLRQRPRMQVLEIFCGPSSELTRQVNKLGFRAERHGMSEGDLATKIGRQKLFQTILECRPQHLWYSPTCGPWCAWSVLNESHSEASFARVQAQREEHLYQLALGLMLYRYQCIHQRHMHWEQPARSLMLKTPYLYEIAQGTYVAKFDMCQVGEMRDPQNQKLFKKGMEIHSTSQQFYFQFNGRKCNHQHEHQTLEGQTIVKGIPIPRTAFSENYTRKFARSIAQVLTKVKNMKERPIICWDETAFALSGIKRPSSQSSSGFSAKRAKLQNSSLIEPMQMPSKRRRIHDKAPEQNVNGLCDQIYEQVSKIMPRVGRKIINDPQIMQNLQELFHDKMIVKAVVCKGTERTIQPPKDMIPSEAPYRRAIIVQRNTKKILVEDQWEHWEFLSARQQWRRSHPSYMNITVFARNHPMPEQSFPSPKEDNRQEIREDASETIRANEPARAVQSSETPDEFHNAPSLPSPSPDVPDSDETPMNIDANSNNHGPKFLALSSEQKKLALRLHKNLGHPDPRRLSQVLQQRGYAKELSQGVLDLKCSICQMQQRPKIPKPATLKSELHFGDKVSIDGVKWTNKQGQDFHFYHFIDHGTNYHAAIIAPNRAEIQERFTMGWLNWAGPPNTIVMDSAKEFVSEAFTKFLQSLNIQCEVVPPDAHWQCGRVERHGGVLQSMLSKFELEHDVSSYPKFQQALTQCVMAKNSCSLRHGYAPDTLVFGKGLRLPASITSDDSLPAHAIAECEDQAGVRFRELLSMREAARRAFHAADNDMSLRRAALRRERPHRGSYEAGEWVMVWKLHNFKGSWVGPARVIKQDSSTTVFCNNAGSIVKAAPEHVRPVSAVEARLIPLSMPPIPNLESSSQCFQKHPNNQNPIITDESPEVPPVNSPITLPNAEENPPSNASDQPESEGIPITPHNPELGSHVIPPESNPTIENPELQPHEIPVPDDADDELLCDLLTCTDDHDLMMPDGENLVWRAEIEISPNELATVCQSAQNPTEEEFLFLATAGKRQRTEVKLCTLDPSERLEFEKAKSKEVQNWLQTGTAKLSQQES